MRELALEQVLDLLRSLALKIKKMALAIGARVRDFFAMVAVMADQPRFAFVKGQRDVAVAAADRLAARAAEDELRKAAPVQ